MIDDQAVVRQGFVALINTVPDMEVIAEGINGQQAIDLYSQHTPDVTLIDLRMPVVGGVEAITAIRQKFPDARLIVLTTYDGDEDIYRSLQAGARGYLLKDVFFEELETAIRSVHAGSRHIPAARTWPASTPVIPRSMAPSPNRCGGSMRSIFPMRLSPVFPPSPARRRASRPN